MKRKAIAFTSFIGCLVVLAPSAKAAIIESFEDGNIIEYSVVLGSVNAAVTPPARHHGLFGLEIRGFGGGEGWIFRNDPAVQVAQGATISYWVNPNPSSGQRDYCGFGATAAGCYSIVVAPNTNELILQLNPGYGFQNLAAVPQVWTLRKWYRLEVQWAVGGLITGRLFDSDGTTLLNTVVAFDNTFTQGGIAFRAFDFGTPSYFDEITSTGGCQPGNLPPFFTPPTPICGSVIEVQAGQPVTFTVRAADADSTDEVKLEAVGVPPGASMPLPAPGNPVSSVFNWVPGFGDAGDHTINVLATDQCQAQAACSLTVRVVTNRNPDCRLAHGSWALTWPPNHKLTPLTVEGVTDPDGDPVTIVVTDVKQDEPVDDVGDGRTCPDAVITGGQVQLRAERSGTGNGRIYRVSFTASDGRGGSCSGRVFVCVPHDQDPDNACVDDGAEYRSLGPCSGGGRRIEGLGARLGVTPAEGTVTVEYSLDADVDVNLAIYDVAGRRLATLVSGRQPAGEHQVSWDMSHLQPGVYFCRLLAGGQSRSESVFVR